MTTPFAESKFKRQRMRSFSALKMAAGSSRCLRVAFSVRSSAALSCAAVN